MQGEKDLSTEYYNYGGIGRFKLVLYGILAAILQICLIAPLFFIVPNPENVGIGVILYMILIGASSIIYGFYLIYQRCKNIGINPWVGTALLFIPIINLFWSLGLYILPEGFWDNKCLDKAAKIWVAIIILLVTPIIIGGALFAPPLLKAVAEEQIKLKNVQGKMTSPETTASLNEKSPLDQSYGLDTKCPNYSTTIKSFDKILNALKSLNPENSKLVLSEIAQAQGSLNPLIIGLAANLMVQRGQTEKALFWLYAGELRTLSDLNLYKNKQIPSIFLQEYLGNGLNNGRVSALSPKATTQIELFIEGNRRAAKIQLAKALEWDKKTAKDYNRAWLGTAGTIPQPQWQQQDKKTRLKFQQTELASIGVDPIESVFKPNPKP